jgi:hypothetical protein
MSWVGAVLLVGWLGRLTQSRVLHGWWRRSPRRGDGSFDDFLATLGPAAPTAQPNWLLHERSDQPWRFAALLANARMGVRLTAGTFLLAGWGTALMAASWEFGWNHSFHKVYEESLVGRAVGVAGWGLFALAMVYVPMAQAHAAVTEDVRSFFDFHFVCQLIRARLAAYVVLAALFLQLGLFQEGLKTVPTYFDGYLPSWTDLSDEQALLGYRFYYLCYSAFILASLLLTRLTAGWVYQEALVRSLRRGWVTPEVLHPRLHHWLDRLGILSQRAAGVTTVGPTRAAGQWVFRALAAPTLFLLWVAFGAKTYVGEFVHYHPLVGFLNQPLVMVPYADHTPGHLVDAVREGRPAR